MNKSKDSSKKSTATTRRKFLSGLGVAAATVAVFPALTATKAIRNRKGLAAAKRQGAKRSSFLTGMRRMKTVAKISRPLGTSQMPLEIRPV